MLAKVKAEVGEEAESSWKYLLRGLWDSRLWLDELMHVHWVDSNTSCHNGSGVDCRSCRSPQRCKK